MNSRCSQVKFLVTTYPPQKIGGKLVLKQSSVIKVFWAAGEEKKILVLKTLQTSAMQENSIKI